MKKRTNKKGFTLVELLVVIGIIAVLAVVSVVGYFGFIKKANLSNDQSAITQMNIGLQADAVEKDGKYTYAGEAVQALYAQGWNKGKMQPYSSEYKYAYSLDKNKMYLLDESDNVVFPDSNVEKSTLWGFYYDSVNKISGVTQYIAMDNITNEDNFNTQVGSDSYTFDLNGYFIAVKNHEYKNVTIKNGILVHGTFINGTDLIVRKQEKPQADKENKTSGLTTGTTYENKVFYNFGQNDWADGQRHIIKESNITFKNCYFYSCAISTETIMNFENCYFIDGYYSNIDNKGVAAIEIYYPDDKKDEAVTINIKNCTFTNTRRGINLDSKDKDLTINVENCTFNGVEDAKFAAIQIAKTTPKINFKNNTINSLGTATTIVRFHENLFKTPGLSTNDLGNIIFSDNIVSSKISKDNYLDLDNGRKAEFNPDFYNAALDNFVASVTTK